MKIRTPQEMLSDGIIVTHLAGSKAYMTSTPESDTDIRGIFCADESFLRSPWFTVNEVSIPEDEDTKFYELTNFMRLLVDQNPNIVESLWVHPCSILSSTPAYEYLRSRREELLSTKIAFTFSGYALSQLKRIKGHNGWINNPEPKEPPRQIDYIKLIQDFSSNKFFKFSGVDMNNYRHSLMLIPYGNNLFGMYPSRDNKTLFSDDFTLNTVFDGSAQDYGLPLRIIKFNIEEYKLKLQRHRQYWGWRKNRNVSRSELEEKFGYDTKHAMHLVRLLRMGKEVLTTGEVHVLRPDAEELLDIRRGKLSYKELVQYAEEMDNDIKNVHYKESVLRSKVNIHTASEILFETQNIVWQNR